VGPTNTPTPHLIDIGNCPNGWDVKLTFYTPIIYCHIKIVELYLYISIHLHNLAFN